MKNNYSLFLLFIAFCTISASSGKKTFTAWIIQDDKKVEVTDNEVALLKKPFVIQLALNGTEGVTVNISFDRTYYDPAAERQIHNLANLAPNTMAENAFNSEKELLVSKEYVCYWYYDPKDSLHRMDRNVVINGKQTICQKTIEKIFDTDTNEKYQVGYIRKDLYLTFVSTKNKKYPAEPKVIDVNRVKIKWTN